MYCIKCGHELKEGEKYCSNCGYKIGTIEPNSEGANSNISMPSSIPTQATQNGVQGKSKVAAALLAIFLGSLGIHNFYLGRTKEAIGQLSISIISGILSLLLFVASTFNLIDPQTYAYTLIFPKILSASVSIWGFIDFILILSDKLKPGKNYFIEK